VNDNKIVIKTIESIMKNELPLEMTASILLLILRLAN